MAFRPLKSFFSTADELLQQDLPALGAVLLTHLKSYEGLNTVYQHAGLNRGYFRAMLENRNIGLGPLPKEPEYGTRQPEVTKRMMEAWNWLERQGLLIHNDQQVADWFTISSDGEEHSDQAPPAPNPARVSKSVIGAPRALLSYSWDGLEHQQWVNNLAERLQKENGVEVVFDQWYLNPGDDRLHFMERGVADSDFVIVVCTPTYAERANRRERGVGYESMVITAELAKNILTNKFIPVLRGGTWDSSLPTYLGSKMGVDLSGEPFSEPEYEKLLRVLHGEPIQPPPLGKKPDFSRESATGVKLSRAVGSVTEASPKPPTKASCNFSPRALLLSKELSVRAFPAIQESTWSEEIELTVAADTSEIDSIFSRFRGHKDVLVVAYGFDVAVAKLRSLNRVVSGGKALWKVQFDPIRTEFSNDMEVGTSGTSADQFAEKRVRRLLLNENPMAFKSDTNDMIGLANEAMSESLVQGLNSIVKIQRSSFIDLHTDFGTNPIKFVEIAWISAVADLKLSAAVQHIDHLTLELNRNILNVNFSGRRHRKYVNVPPFEVNVKGSMILPSND
jgi:hypothetical protein